MPTIPEIATKLRATGHSYSFIAETLEISIERAKANVRSTRDSELDWNHSETSFSNRTVNCIVRNGLSLDLDSLRKYGPIKLLALPNMGRKSLREIAEALYSDGKIDNIQTWMFAR